MLLGEKHGARFREEDGGWMHLDETHHITTDALEDMRTWLEFASVKGYLTMLAAERETIFDRARY